MTDWTHTLVAFALPAGQAAANAFWGGIDIDTGGALSFEVACSATGAAPASAYGMMCPLNAVMRDRIAAAIDAGSVPPLRWYLINRVLAVLLRTNSSTAVVGSTFTPRDALADAGLRLIPQVFNGP